jgi:hypothetical protein
MDYGWRELEAFSPKKIGEDAATLAGPSANRLTQIPAHGSKYN